MNDKKDIDYDKISREEDIKDRKLDNLINIVEIIREQKGI